MLNEFPLQSNSGYSFVYFEMFLGEIVAVYVNEDCITDGKPNPLKLNPIIMMGASYYSLNEVVGNLFRTGLTLSENK